MYSRDGLVWLKDEVRIELETILLVQPGIAHSKKAPKNRGLFVLVL